MGRKLKKRPIEGEKKTMKQLTKDHDSFMASRNAGRTEENEQGVEKFESLLSKSFKQRS